LFHPSANPDGCTNRVGPSEAITPLGSGGIEEGCRVRDARSVQDIPIKE
jgi:hypothetical protein